MGALASTERTDAKTEGILVSAPSSRSSMRSFCEASELMIRISKIKTIKKNWPVLRSKMQDVFLTRTRDEWSTLLEGKDACAVGVLSPEEATRHPHLVARKTFVESAGGVQPAPAPRFSRTRSMIQCSLMTRSVTAAEAMRAWE